MKKITLLLFSLLFSITLFSQDIEISNFTLVDAGTNEDILELSEGDEINLMSYPGIEFNIRANVTGDVNSVRLRLSGALTHNMTESVAPYALYGDLPAGEYNGQVFPVGSYTISATPYSEASAGGTAGNPFSVNFEMIDTPLQRPFITTWKTDNPGASLDNQITIPTFPGETYSYTIDWGDGQVYTHVSNDVTHTYEIPGTYQVSIYGDFPRIYFNGSFQNGGDSKKIVSVDQWGDGAWSSMANAFSECSNLDVTAMDVPNLSNVEDISNIFTGCYDLQGSGSFNEWNTSNITDMSGMFIRTSFNQDISGWDVDNVRNMNSLFALNTHFNQNISNWNVKNVEDMYGMFFEAWSFNQPIGTWNVSKVIDMNQMFGLTRSFNQDLGNWDLSSINQTNEFNGLADMFNGSALSVENYDKTLIGWATLETIETQVPQNVIFDGGNSPYCLGEEARQKLIDDFGWTITDGGKTADCPDTTSFITTWKTDNEGLSNDNEVLIFIIGNSEVTIDWGDGTIDSGVTQPITHVYDVPGTYQIAISGNYPRIIFGYTAYSYGNDRNKLVSVDQWGDTQWTTMEYAFKDCQNVQILAEDVPDLSLVTSMGRMFQNADSMNEDISSWDFSSVTNMFRMFLWADSYNQDITKWNFTDSISLGDFLSGASSFDQDLGNLDLSKISSMAGFLSGSGLSQENYDKTLIGWANQSFIPLNLRVNVDGTSFCGGANARQEIIDNYGWNIYDGGLACPSSIPFITSWKTDNEGSSGDNQITFPILSPAEATIDWGDGTINTKVKQSITHTYGQPGIYQISVSGILPNLRFGPEVTYFDTDKDKLISVDQWGDTMWVELEAAFQNCQNVQILAEDAPDLSNVSSLRYMFSNTDSMNNDISFWDFSSITNMNAMFFKADSYNKDLISWNLGNQVDLSSMFGQAESFDQDLGGLDLSKITSLSGFLSYSGLSKENYDRTLIGWAKQDEIPQDIWMQVEGVTFCQGEESRQKLIDDFGWTFVDGGRSANCQDTTSFITTWKTDNPGTSEDNQITIPIFPGTTYNFNVDWGDGNSDIGVMGEITHTYDTAGVYIVKLSGYFPINFHTEKLLSVNQWGGESLGFIPNFRGCTNLDVLATDIPNFSNVDSVDTMFLNCVNLVGNATIGNWDVSGITEFDSMFKGASSFNQDISAWDVSSAIDMEDMFNGASSFNQDISSWNVSGVSQFFGMFQEASSFNIDISNWDVSAAFEMTDMFKEAAVFNQDISIWKVGNVRSMYGMFHLATSFNQDLSSWNVANVIDMTAMFNGVTLSINNFDSLLNGWSSQQLQNGVTFDGGNSQYCQGEDARQKLIDDFGWIITDGGKSETCTTDNVILDFTLVDSEFGQDLLTLENDKVYDIDVVSTGLLLNIRANTNPDPVGSVALSLSGPIDKQMTENVSPYALFGNSGPIYNGVSFAPGTYTVTATPYTERLKGGEMGEPKSLTFTLAFAPMAFSSTASLQVVEDTEVSFIGSNSSDENGDNDLSYLWDFGVGGASTEADPTYVFENPGEYSVKLTVTNSFGLTSETSLTIQVELRELSAPEARVNITGPFGSVGPAPLEAGFIGSISIDDIGIVSYVWDFGDGGSSTEADPTHTFETPGDYLVNFTVTDTDGLTDSTAIPFTIVEPGNTPPRAFISLSTSYGIAPLEVSFDASNSVSENGIASYFWDFGDGNTSIEANPTHVYTVPGEYVATLVLTDNAGLTNENGGFGIRAADPADDIYFLEMVDVSTNEVLFDLPENLGSTPLSLNDNGLNIRALVNEETVESVKFELSGPLNHTQIESVADYMLFGNNGDTFFTQYLPEGEYFLTVTTYGQNNAQGAPRASKTVRFVLVDYSQPFGDKSAAAIGKKPQKTEDLISLYPNMATDYVNMEVTSSTVEVDQILIHDMMGRQVAQYEPENVSIANGYRLPVEELPAGMYALTIQDSKGGVVRKLLGIKK